MCRYAQTAYKPHFACFGCRKAYKRRLMIDINRDKVFNGEKDQAAVCPECGEPMADMGLDFEAPKQKDTKAWKHLENLYTAGITFHSCGCVGPGYIPRDKEELLNLLETRKEDYTNQALYWASRRLKLPEAEQLQHFKVPTPKQTGLAVKYDKLTPKQAVDYWAERVEMVSNRIESIHAQQV